MSVIVVMFESREFNRHPQKKVSGWFGDGFHLATFK